MRRIKLLATDVDGTLSLNRETVLIDPEVINVVRKLESRGIMVSLVSSTALPVVAGLKRYMGASGPAIGETGAIVFFGEDEVVHLTSLSTREIVNVILEKFGEYVRESWQNEFRYHDLALKVRKKYLECKWEIYKEIREWVLSRYNNVKVEFSGYAIHVLPVEIGKGKALRYVMNRLGISREEAAAIGDSYMDLELFKVAGLRAAVGNADEELKEKADVVLKGYSSRGFIEFAKLILESF